MDVKTRKPLWVRGEDHGRSKFSDKKIAAWRAEVKRARERGERGVQAKIARRDEVNERYLSMLINDKIRRADGKILPKKAKVAKKAAKVVVKKLAAPKKSITAPKPKAAKKKKKKKTAAKLKARKTVVEVPAAPETVVEASPAPETAAA